MRLSYSALSAFSQCPQKYKWQYIDRIKVPPTPDLFFGSLIHDLLDIMLKNDPVIVPLDKITEIYKNRFDPKVFEGDISADEYFNDGLEILKTFHASHTPGLTTIYDTEKFFEIYWEGHKIVGKIDRIDKLPTGEIEIIDYKTNKKLPHESDFKFDLQLPLYEWAAKTIWNDVKDVKLSLYFLRHNKKITPDNIRSLDELQAYINKLANEISGSAFFPAPSKLCGWCEYLFRCKEGQDFLKGNADNENTQEKINKYNQDSLF